jgi:hypothetical protein
MEPVMAEQRSAEIIPFPIRRAANDPQRLHRALSVLNGALAEQRQVVTQWRGAVGDLQGSVRRLGGSVQLYQARLVALREKVGALHDEAVRQATRFEDGNGTPPRG